MKEKEGLFFSKKISRIILLQVQFRLLCYPTTDSKQYRLTKSYTLSGDISGT